MHKTQQNASIRAAWMPNTKLAANESGIMAEKKKDRFFHIREHISAIRSIIRAATPASIPFKTAAITALAANAL